MKDENEMNLKKKAGMRNYRCQYDENLNTTVIKQLVGDGPLLAKLMDVSVNKGVDEKCVRKK